MFRIVLSKTHSTIFYVYFAAIDRFPPVREKILFATRYTWRKHNFFSIQLFPNYFL